MGDMIIYLPCIHAILIITRSVSILAKDNSRASELLFTMIILEKY